MNGYKICVIGLGNVGLNLAVNFSKKYQTIGFDNDMVQKALRGEKGVYTHNSVRTGKSDVWPQKELIDMLKSIATSGV